VRDLRWKTVSWTPALPFLSFSPLHKDKPAVYIERFAERFGRGGWLVESKKTSAPELFPWFYQALDQSYIATETLEDDHWRLIRYEPQAQIAKTPGADPVRR
jgi:hypothetical protein